MRGVTFSSLGLGFILGYLPQNIIPQLYFLLTPVKDVLACISFIVAIAVGLKQLWKKKD